MTIENMKYKSSVLFEQAHFLESNLGSLNIEKLIKLHETFLSVIFRCFNGVLFDTHYKKKYC